MMTTERENDIFVGDYGERISDIQWAMLNSVSENDFIPSAKQ